MNIIQVRIRPHNEVDLLVVERHDNAKRSNNIRGSDVSTSGLIEEGLIDVRLHNRELHERLVTQAPNILGRPSRGQHLEIDVCLRSHERSQITPDLDIRTAR